MIEPVVVRTLEGAEFHQNSPVLSLVKIPVKSAQWAQMGGSYIYKVLNCDAILRKSFDDFHEERLSSSQFAVAVRKHKFRLNLVKPWLRNADLTSWNHRDGRS